MTLQEQIDRVLNEHPRMVESEFMHKIIRKQSEMLKVAEEALRSCILFAGCEREYDEQLVEKALAIMENEGV